jgi:MFS family permease
MISTNSNAVRHPKLFYGWIIVAIGFVTLVIAFGVWYSFSVFFLAVIDEFGWSRAATSSIFSVFILCHALMGILAGHLQDRFGPRVVIPAGAIMLVISLALTSQAKYLWHFSLAYGVFAGMGVGLIGFISHAAFIPKWFERKRGLAVGITMAGIGFGMLILVPLVERFITAFGWRNAYLILAGLVLLVVAPLNLIFSRRSPEDLNLRPDGDDADMDRNRKKPVFTVKIVDAEWANREWTIGKALRTRRFWFLLFAFFFTASAFQGTLLHSVSSMVDAGLNRDTASYYFGIVGIAGSGGKILFGYLSDLYGRERINTLGGFIATLGILSLMSVASLDGPMPLLFALLFGIGYGSAAPLLPSVGADIFMGSSFGMIFAMIGIGGGLGGALGSFIAGLLRDASGAYYITFTVCCINILLANVFIWLAGPRKVRRMLRS